MAEDGGGAGDRQRRAADDAPQDQPGEAGRRGRPCPYCAASMYRRHCKYVCPNHGVVIDCADPF